MMFQGSPSIPAADNLERVASVWLAYITRTSPGDQACLSSLAPTKEEALEFFSSGMSEHVIAYVNEHLQTILREQHIPKFWGHIEACSRAAASKEDASLGSLMHTALKELFVAVEDQRQVLVVMVDHFMELCAQHSHEGGASVFHGACNRSVTCSNPALLAPQLLNLVPSCMQPQCDMQHSSPLSYSAAQPGPQVPKECERIVDGNSYGLLRRYYSCKVDQLGEAMAACEDRSVEHTVSTKNHCF
eukprot:gene26226-11961_t